MADGFLGRWSRRKQEVREGKPLEEPPPPAPSVPSAVALAPQPVSAVAAGAAPAAAQSAAPVAEAPPAPTLADAQALTPASDFKAFVARDVSPEVRNLAMKKLFADPHFNVMDGLDIYIGDYTQPDPLPEGMLRKMASAHAMGFFDHEKKAGPDGAPETPVDEAAAEVAAGTDADAAAAPAPAPAPIAPAAAQPRDDAEEETPSDVAQSGVCTAIPSDPSSEREVVIRPDGAAVAIPASHSEHDHHAHLRLQPDDAPQREGVGRGTA